MLIHGFFFNFSGEILTRIVPNVPAARTLWNGIPGDCSIQ